MIHTIKNSKWVITTSLICILFGLLTFFTFIDKSFIDLNKKNFQLLLIFDLVLLALFFLLIIRETYKVLKAKHKGQLGSETRIKYLAFFSLTTLLPSLLIATFSLVLFYAGLEKYFNAKIKSAVNNSYDVAKNYIEDSKRSITSDITLVYIDINNQFSLFYDNPKKFQSILASQRLLRRLDEIHLIDSSGNIIMSNIIDPTGKFVPPPEEAFIKSLNNKPVRITDSFSNRTSALIKLNNFIDTYLYIVKFMDPKMINYLKDTEQAVNFYYSVENQQTGIKITFAIIYLLIVALLLFLSIIISINFASRLTLPIINLIKASTKVSSGDLNAKVPKIETDKDFEKLNENFNLMLDKIKTQQEKLLFTERHAAWENVARKLAHEIKNPLTPIQLSIDRIREKYLYKIKEDKENFSSYLNTITKQIKDIEHLLNEFSDFARMPKPIFKKMDLVKTISTAIKLLEVSDKTININFSKSSSSYFIFADEEQFNRVFINLIKNSIESINEIKSENVDFKGKINIDIIEDKEYIYVDVLDNGVGFDLVDKTKMLTPYYTTKNTGTGLGLAVVKKIINDHNSLINFNSVTNGAKVNITIPKYYG